MIKVVGSMRDSHKSAANGIVRGLLDRFHGAEINREHSIPDDAHLFIQWGFKATRALMTCILRKIPYVIIDMGYFEPTRAIRQSISINGLHGLSLPVDVLDLPPRPHPRIEQWRDGGEKVLVIGQLPGDAALRGENPDTWMHKQAVLAAEAFGKPTHKRPHPKMLNPWEPAAVPIQEALDDTYVCVTYTSTVAVQAIVAGVSTVATHRGSPAYNMCSHTLAKIRLPGRESWVHDLSYREYNLLDAAELDAAAFYIERAYPAAAVQAKRGMLEIPRVRP